MVEEVNSAQGDVPYVMPDAEAAYAKAGAAFQGAAWVHDAAYRQSEEVRAAAADLAEQHRLDNTVTANDIAGIIASVKAKCMAQGVPLAEMDKIVAHINGNVGAPKSQLDDIKQAAFAEAAQAAANANDDRTQNVMYAQQHDHLWNEVNELQEDIKTRMQRLLHEGKISEKDYKNWESAYQSSKDPTLTEEQRIQATSNAADAADHAVKGIGGQDADGIRTDTKSIRHDLHGLSLLAQGQPLPAAEEARLAAQQKDTINAFAEHAPPTLEGVTLANADAKNNLPIAKGAVDSSLGRA